MCRLALPQSYGLARAEHYVVNYGSQMHGNVRISASGFVPFAVLCLRSERCFLSDFFCLVCMKERFGEENNSSNHSLYGLLSHEPDRVPTNFAIGYDEKIRTNSCRHTEYSDTRIGERMLQ